MSDNDKLNETNTPQKIEVITGDGNLNISPVYDHIEAEKPRPKDTRDVIVPQVKNDVVKKEE